MADTYEIKKFSGHVVPANYINFIFLKWMKSFRFGNEYIKLSDSGTYYAAYHRYISNILQTPGVDIRLAVLSDNPDVALGFSAVRGLVLHYVFVGKDYRLQGIAKKLVPVDINEFTHLTKTGLRLWSTELPEAIFNPFR